MSDEPSKPDDPGPRYELPSSHAESRPGFRAPEPDARDDELRRLQEHLKDEQTMAAVEHLFYVMAPGRGDPLYRHLKPELVILKEKFKEALAKRPDDLVAAAQLRRVRKLLPPRDQA